MVHFIVIVVGTSALNIDTHSGKFDYVEGVLYGIFNAGSA
jgi:hypothetical protein